LILAIAAARVDGDRQRRRRHSGSVRERPGPAEQGQQYRPMLRIIEWLNAGQAVIERVDRPAVDQPAFQAFPEADATDLEAIVLHVHRDDQDLDACRHGPQAEARLAPISELVTAKRLLAGQHRAVILATLDVEERPERTLVLASFPGNLGVAPFAG